MRPDHAPFSPHHRRTLAVLAVFLTSAACVTKRGMYSKGPADLKRSPDAATTATSKPDAEAVEEAPANADTGGGGTVNLQDLDRLWALPFPKDGTSDIRVKIYPHHFKAAAKAAAEPLGSVTLKGRCTAYEGTPGRVGKGKRKIAAGSNFRATVAMLKKPVWLDCDGAIMLERGAPLPSYDYVANFYVHATSQAENGPGKFVEVIAVMPLDTYLRGVVPTEVVPSWPAETLKAQAVAARTFASFNIAHNRVLPNGHLYDVDDTNRFQAFSGITNVHPATDAAVAETAGEVLTYKDKLILTFFDTDAGGVTEDGTEVFNLAIPYCVTRAEPPEVAAEASRWQAKTTLSELKKLLPTAVPAGRSLKKVEVDRSTLTPSGRVQALAAVLDNGSNASLPYPELRRVLPDVKSALFATTSGTDGSVRFDGRGSGHGVGMSQAGANSMAKKLGWDYRKILDFYYKGVRLCSTLGAKSGVPKCKH